jgi:hypothetical protein
MVSYSFQSWWEPLTVLSPNDTSLEDRSARAGSVGNHTTASHCVDGRRMNGCKKKWVRGWKVERLGEGGRLSRCRGKKEWVSEGKVHDEGPWLYIFSGGRRPPRPRGSPVAGTHQ